MGTPSAPLTGDAHIPSIIENFNSDDFNLSSNKEIFNEPTLENPPVVTTDGDQPPSSLIPPADVSIVTAMGDESCGEEEEGNLQEMHVRLTCLGGTVSPLLKVQIDVEGGQALALVDTGATKSMIDKAFLNSVCTPYEQAPSLRIFGVAEPEGIPIAVQVLLYTSIAGIEMNPQHFTVLPENVLPVPVILGADYLELQAMKIDPARRRLAWSTHAYDVDLYIQEDGSTKDRVVSVLQFFAAQSGVVDRRQTAKVPVYWNDGISGDSHSGTLFYHGAVMHKLQERVKGLPGVLQLDNDAPVILFTNDCHQKYTIHRGRPLGIFSSVVELEEEQKSRRSWTMDELREAVDLEHLPDA